MESALRLGRPNLTADINIYIFLNLSIFFYCGCTIFPDGLIWPLSVIQNPEEISKLKRIKRKGKKKSDEIVRGGGVERGEGLMLGDPVLLQFVRLPVALPCPL